MTYQGILAIVFALIAAGFAYFFATRLSISTAFKSSTDKRIDALTSKETRKIGALDRVGGTLLDRLGLSLTSWKLNLMWAQMGGKYLDWTVGGIAFRGVLFGGIGVLYVVLLQAPFFMWLIPVLLFIWPFTRVSTAAEETRNAMLRALPGVTTVIASEMEAGSSAEKALKRASEYPGPLSIIFREAIQTASSSGRPLFSEGMINGTLRQTMILKGNISLVKLASQLDRVNAKGVDAPVIMRKVAANYINDQRARLESAVAGLDNKLLLPMTLFFFVTFMLVLMAPLFVSLFSLF